MISPYQTPEEQQRAADEAKRMGQTQSPNPLREQEAQAEALMRLRAEATGPRTAAPDGGPIRLQALQRSRMPPQLLDLAKQQAPQQGMRR